MKKLSLLLTCLMVSAAVVTSGCSSAPKKPEPPKKQAGPITGEQVNAAVRAKLPEIQDFYEKSVVGHSPIESGKVTVAFTVGPEGKVLKATIKDTTLKYPKVEDFVLKAIRELPLPAYTGTPVEVSYPFQFVIRRK